MTSVVRDITPGGSYTCHTRHRFPVKSLGRIASFPAKFECTIKLSAILARLSSTLQLRLLCWVHWDHWTIIAIQRAFLTFLRGLIDELSILARLATLHRLIVPLTIIITSRSASLKLHVQYCIFFYYPSFRVLPSRKNGLRISLFFCTRCAIGVAWSTEWGWRSLLAINLYWIITVNAGKTSWFTRLALRSNYLVRVCSIRTLNAFVSVPVKYSSGIASCFAVFPLGIVNVTIGTWLALYLWGSVKVASWTLNRTNRTSVVSDITVFSESTTYTRLLIKVEFFRRRARCTAKLVFAIKNGVIYASTTYLITRIRVAQTTTRAAKRALITFQSFTIDSRKLIGSAQSAIFFDILISRRSSNIIEFLRVITSESALFSVHVQNYRIWPIIKRLSFKVCVIAFCAVVVAINVCAFPWIIMVNACITVL